MLDFDQDDAPELYRFIATAHVLHVRIMWIEYFKSRRGWHVRVCFDRRTTWTAAELVAYQAACGSDFRRERLNLMRVRAIRTRKLGSFWQARWNLLFSRKLTR